MKIDTCDLKERFDLLMRMPDPPEMHPRRNHVTQYGRPNRRAEVGIPLLVRWYQRRIVMMEEGGGETR